MRGDDLVGFTHNSSECHFSRYRYFCVSPSGSRKRYELDQPANSFTHLQGLLLWQYVNISEVGSGWVTEPCFVDRFYNYPHHLSTT
jgi:hypothetical protein